VLSMQPDKRAAKTIPRGETPHKRGGWREADPAATVFAFLWGDAVSVLVF
jgi:hypothetical protein